MAEQHVELRWSDLSFLKSQSHLPTSEVFLQYQEEEESLRGGADRGVKKCVRVPISLSSRGVTVAGLSPGSVYTFTLRAAHSSGATWSLGQTRTAHTSESSDSQSSDICCDECLVLVLDCFRTPFSTKHHCRPPYSQSDQDPLGALRCTFQSRLDVCGAS